MRTSTRVICLAVMQAVIGFGVGFGAAVSLAAASSRGQLVITGVAVSLSTSEIKIGGRNLCADPIVRLAGTQLFAAGSGGLILARLPAPVASGDYLLTIDCGRGIKGFDSWNLTIGTVGPPGPLGPPGPSGFGRVYVITGSTHTIGTQESLVEEIRCHAGDASLSWAPEGYGIVVGPGVFGFLNVVPIVDSSTPVGFTFTFLCSTDPTCQVTYRIICADTTRTPD